MTKTYRPISYGSPGLHERGTAHVTGCINDPYRAPGFGIACYRCGVRRHEARNLPEAERIRILENYDRLAFGFGGCWLGRTQREIDDASLIDYALRTLRLFRAVGRPTVAAARERRTATALRRMERRRERRERKHRDFAAPVMDACAHCGPDRTCGCRYGTDRDWCCRCDGTGHVQRRGKP